MLFPGIKRRVILGGCLGPGWWSGIDPVCLAPMGAALVSILGSSPQRHPMLFRCHFDGRPRARPKGEKAVPSEISAEERHRFHASPQRLSRDLIHGRSFRK